MIVDMALYNCHGNTAGSADNTNCADACAANDERVNACSASEASCGGTAGGCEQSCSGSRDLMILAAIVLLLIVLLR